LKSGPRSRRTYAALGLAVVAVVAVAATAAVGLAGSGTSRPVGPTTHAKKQHAPANAADLDGDGHPDEVFTSNRGPVHTSRRPYLAVAYGTGKGPDGEDRAVFPGKRLGLRPQDTTDDPRPATADLDGDGHPEVVAGPGARVVWGGPHGPRRGSPVGRVRLPRDFGSYQQAPVAGDFDGDGHMDLATFTVHGRNLERPGAIVVLHGPFRRTGSRGGARDAVPARTTERKPPEVGHAPVVLGSLSAGDAEGDQATDLVAREEGDNSPPDEEAKATFLFPGGAKSGGQTGGGLGRPRRLPASNDVAFGDFDGDGRRDIAVGNSGTVQPDEEMHHDVQGSITVYYGRHPHTAHRIEGGPRSGGFGRRLRAADVDGDGRDDLAVDITGIWGGGKGVQVLHGAAEGLGSTPWHHTFRSSRAAGDPDNAENGMLYDARDYDGDGKDELAVTDNRWQGPKIAWWFTDGTAHDDSAFTTTRFPH